MIDTLNNNREITFKTVNQLKNKLFPAASPNNKHTTKGDIRCDAITLANNSFEKLLKINARR